MATQNTLKQALTKQNGGQEIQGVKTLLSMPAYQKRFEEILGQKAQGFISSILNLVNNERNLQKADPNSIIRAAAVAAVLDLPIDKNLGFAYIIPYAGVAQFQMGYKGYIQLAIRTGVYHRIHATEIYEGEIESFNRLTGELCLNPDRRTSDTVIGYAAYFSTVNGFESTVYLSKVDLLAHAKRYSKSFHKADSPWQTNEHEMCLKTVQKMNLSKYGMLSVQMQQALKMDQAVITSDAGDVEYIDATTQDGLEDTLTPSERSETSQTEPPPEPVTPTDVPATLSEEEMATAIEDYCITEPGSRLKTLLMDRLRAYYDMPQIDPLVLQAIYAEMEAAK